MGTKNSKPIINNELRIYYSKVIQPLRNVINYSKNKRIITIIPIQNKPYDEWDPREYKRGVIIKYDDNDILELSCDSIEAGVILWYYQIDNVYYTSYINEDFQKYIKKNL